MPESEEYGTLGGLIVNETGEIPEPDTEIRLDHFLFTILESSNTKIDLVALQVLQKE